MGIVGTSSRGGCRQWVDRTQPALLLGPCDDLPGGYWVEVQGTAKDPDELVLFPCTTIFSNIKEPPVLELEGVVEEQEPSPPEQRVRGKRPALGLVGDQKALTSLKAEDAMPHRRRLSSKSPASSLRVRVGSLRCFASGGKSPPVEIFEEDMQGLGKLEEYVKDNVPGDKYWPTCCSPPEDSYLVQRLVTAEVGKRRAKGQNDV